MDEFKVTKKHVQFLEVMKEVAENGYTFYQDGPFVVMYQNIVSCYAVYDIDQMATICFLSRDQLLEVFGVEDV